MMNVAVVIPAYNAAQHITQVLTGVAEHIPLQYVCVIDDGSNDVTAKLAKNLGAVLLVHGSNRGKGAALATGFTWALGMNVEAIVTLDADGQHAPEVLPNFIAAYKRTQCDVIVGTRMQGGASMPLQRRITNTLASRVLSWITGQYIPDSQCGYRLLSARVLAAVPVVGARYEAESLYLAHAAQRGFRISSVAIPVIYGMSKSSFKIMRDTGRVIRVLTVLCLHKLMRVT